MSFFKEGEIEWGVVSSILLTLRRSYSHHLPIPFGFGVAGPVFFAPRKLFLQHVDESMAYGICHGAMQAAQTNKKWAEGGVR